MYLITSMTCMPPNLRVFEVCPMFTPCDPVWKLTGGLRSHTAEQLVCLVSSINEPAGLCCASEHRGRCGAPAAQEEVAAITSAIGGGAWGEQGSAGGLHLLHQLQAIQALQAAQGAGQPLEPQQAGLMGGGALPQADAGGSFLDQLQAHAQQPVRPQVLSHGLTAGRPFDEQTESAPLHASTAAGSSDLLFGSAPLQIFRRLYGQSRVMTRQIRDNTHGLPGKARKQPMAA